MHTARTLNLKTKITLATLPFLKLLSCWLRGTLKIPKTVIRPMMVFNRNRSQVFTSKCGPSAMPSSPRSSRTLPIQISNINSCVVSYLPSQRDYKRIRLFKNIPPFYRCNKAQTNIILKHCPGFWKPIGEYVRHFSRAVNLLVFWRVTFLLPEGK